MVFQSVRGYGLSFLACVLALPFQNVQAVECPERLAIDATLDGAQPRPPLKDVQREFEAVLRSGKVRFQQVQPLSFPKGFFVQVPSFVEAVELDRAVALVGFRGYPIVVELSSSDALSAPDVLRAEVQQSMLFKLHPEGVMAWLRNPQNITIHEYHRDQPPTFKIAPELRAFLAADFYRTGQWQRRPMRFQIEDSKVSRDYMHADISEREWEAANAAKGLPAAAQACVHAGAKVWRALREEYVVPGGAMVNRDLWRYNPRVTEQFVDLTFETQEDFREFITEPGVALVDFAFPPEP